MPSPPALLRLLLLALALAVAGCGRAAPERPSVLLVTVDTLRADHLSSYGFPLQTTPQLDALAARGVLFERAIAAASTTAPSHASIMTSRFTRGHSIGFLNDGSRLEGERTLAELFRESGYRTGGFVGNLVLQRRNGFDRGFEVYDDELPDRERNRAAVRERRAEDTTARALAWLESQAGEPVFLWVHYQDPHGPYTPPDGFAGRFQLPPDEDERELPVVESELAWEAIPAYQALDGLSRPSEYRSRYADEIFYTDAWIGRLVAAFEARDADSVILVTADHGESLGEDGRYFMHGFATTPQLARVPMILVAPGLAPARRRDLVHHVDVMPTLLELAGLEVPADARGLALAPSLRTSGVLPERTVYCDIGSEVSAYRTDDALLRALGAIGAWSEAGDVEPVWHAYAWRDDGSWERVPAVAAPSDEVRRYVRSAVPLVRNELAPERIAELRALGYAVDGHGADSDSGARESRNAPNAERR